METDELKINATDIIARLAKIQADTYYIREHIADITLTENDLKDINEAKRDLKQEKTRRL